MGDEDLTKFHRIVTKCILKPRFGGSTREESEETVYMYWKKVVGAQLRKWKRKRPSTLYKRLLKGMGAL